MRRLITTALMALGLLSCSDLPTETAVAARHTARIVNAVVVTPATASVAVGGTANVHCTVYDNGNATTKVCGWKSLDTTVATVSPASSRDAVVTGKRAGTALVRGGNSGFQDTVTVTVAAPARMVLSPDTLRLTVGGAADTLRVTGTTITPAWDYDPAAANCLAAGFGATQFVTGWKATAPCTVRVWATSGTQADTSVVIATSGSGGNVQITTVAQFSAFLGSGIHATRDTGWVRTGTYAGQFTLSASNVVVRAWPGERAKVDGKVLVTGSDDVWWGMEGTDSRTTGDEWDAITVRGPRFKVISAIIHDQRGNGIEATGTSGPGFEATGFLLIHNGLKGAGDHVPDVAHGLYVQNDPGTPKVIRGGIIMGTQGYGVHAYGQGAQLSDLTFTDNIIANNGQQDGCNVMVGGAFPVVRLIFSHNSLSGLIGNGCLWVGRLGPSNGPSTVTDNIVYGGDPTLRAFDWGSTLTAQNNVFVNISGLPQDFEGQTVIAFGGNKWYGAQPYAVPSGDTFNGVKPSGQDVRVAANPYESGRANIAVFNWSGASSATASVPGLGAYELRDAENFYGGAVGSGTGPTVTLPMGGAQFKAFVVAPTGTLP